MKLNYKHAFVVLAMAFLFAAPAIAAADAGGAVVAQDINEDFIFELIENGAEIVFASIDPQGAPAVIYGQIGIPSTSLGLDQSGPGEMYDGCIAMALLATQGELIDYLFGLIGGPLLNLSTGGDDFIATQFGEGGFDVNSILEMIGTEFSLLINVFVDVTDAEAHANMGAIRTHLHTEFEFSFSELLDLRIDESFFPPEMGITLPFDGINVFIYQITNTFEKAVESVLGVMDQSGFLNAIDISVFTKARASGAGLLAVPDMGVLMSLLDGFMGDSENVTPSSFLISQLPDLDGPLALVGAGYIGDQKLSTNSYEIKIFEDLLGKDSLTTDYDSDAGVVFWNSTAYSNQPDYTVKFEEGVFPPLVKITRIFTPASVASGGTVTVNVGVQNAGNDPIYNISLSDTSIGVTYPGIPITGTQTATSSVLDAGEWLNITYFVTFENEGGYKFDPATVSYDFDNTTYVKSSHTDGYYVSSDPLSLIYNMIADGMPFTGIAIGVVGLGAIVNIGLMARGKGGGGSYQV